MKHRYRSSGYGSLQYVQEDLRPRQPLFLYQRLSVNNIHTCLASRSYLEWSKNLPPLRELVRWRLYSGWICDSPLDIVEAREQRVQSIQQHDFFMWQ